MDWKKAVEKEGRNIDIPGEWLPLYYYETLTILFRVENALRVFVYAVLKNEFHEKWLDLNITSDDSEESTIKSIAKKRMAQASTYGYLGYAINCPMLHLTSGELIRLITSESYWKYFRKYFLGSKEIIKNKLDEIGAIRNSLAHFRPIKEDDVDVIKQNAKHVLAEVEKCLFEMMTCNKIIPTNMDENWYKELRTLGTENCTLSFNQSNDENWIRITLAYDCPLLKQQMSNTEALIRYRILNIKTSAIVEQYPVLCNLLTYISEEVPYTRMDEKRNVKFSKRISMVFNHEVLSKEYAQIKKALEELLLLISKEQEMITQDNLASGRIVDAVVILNKLRGSGKDAFWSMDIGSLSTPVKENDSPEYWGSLGYVPSHFISDTDMYPWMPVKIGSYDLPF
ncbi:MAG: Swt1 family HEPN domain-containing protein [candidate division Zixibacteria bacterium]|nr:Swt1 family HEPN domain-containing protein [candidate division Zixibacteria bacterium]